MSAQPSQSASGDQSASSDKGRFSALIGGLSGTSADRADQADETGQPDATDQANVDDHEATAPKPTFTAHTSGPPTATVPEQRDTAQPVAPDGGVRRTPGSASTTTDTAETPAVPMDAVMDQPLLGDVAALRARWQRVQAGFVDDPQEAVGEAADMIEQTAQALVGALRQRQRQLRTMWERGEGAGPQGGQSAAAQRVPDTEHLRQMMRHYRALFNQLCRP